MRRDPHRRLALAFVALLATGATLAAERLEVSAGERLEVRLPTGGDLTIRGDASGEVRLSDGDDYRLERVGDGVRLVPRRSDGAGPSTLRVSVPRRFDVDVESAGGNVQLRQLDGQLWVKTRGGDVEVEDCDGTVELSTAGGDLTVEGGRLEGKLETRGGDVVVRDVDGLLESSAIGGDVVYSGGRSVGQLNLDVAGGDIQLRQAVEALGAKVVGGDLSVTQVDEDAHIRVSGGDARIRRAAGGVDLEVMGGSVELELETGGADREVRLVTLGGDVEVLIPSGLDLDIEVELAISRGAGRDYEITSDVELDIERDRDWRGSGRDAVKRIRGYGRVGDGSTRLRVTVRDGDVVLRQR